MNRASWQLGQHSNLIAALTARGHDVFTFEYRGTSGSRRDGPGRWSYSIDAHVDHDFPALLAEVERLTGAPQVHWVGHSLGGMLLYLYAGRHGSDRIRRVVTLGSPVRFKLPRGVPGLLARAVAGLLCRGLRTPLRIGAFLTLPLSILLRRIFMPVFLNPDHLSGREVSALCSTALEDVSGRIHGLFIDLAAGSKHLSPPIDSGLAGIAPGGLSNLTAPLLVVAGSIDRIAAAQAVKPAFERAQSAQAAYICLGSESETAQAPPFGHCDLASSAAALDWVLPLLVDWFEHPSPRAPSAQLSRGLEFFEEGRP
jgi:pimeloyl-ACP methyl ester carboxylesterase